MPRKNPEIAHKMSGRVRIRLPQDLSEDEANALVKDLRASPDVAKVTWRGTSVIIEHSPDADILAHSHDVLRRKFPQFERWSDEFDANVSKLAADPWVNKSLPAGIIGLAVYAAVRDGSLLAGQSAFALAYIAFDLYWKFQQENLMQKIQRVMPKPALSHSNSK